MFRRCSSACSFVNKCRELTKQIQTSSEKTQVLNNMLEEEKRQIDTLGTQLSAQRARRDAALNDCETGRATIKTKVTRPAASVIACQFTSHFFISPSAAR